VASRRLLRVLLAFAVLAVAVQPAASSASSDADLIRAACSIPTEWLQRTWRGWDPGRGPELQFLPAQPNFVGSGLPHVGPWPYVQDIPMFWYGPGYIRARGPVRRPVTLAGIAPTQAQLLQYDFQPIDGTPMTEALVPGIAAKQPPKLLVTLVWDAGGRDVLNTWPHDWPYLKSLIPQGTWYEHASVGSSPTSTAQNHATIGTGDFPDHHLLVAHRLRIGGTITTPWELGPAYLDRPTLADLYDRAMGNKPIVGTSATVNIHLGMMGHGAFFNGGDRDIAMTRSITQATTITDEGFKWNLPANIERYYTLPPYLNDVPGFKTDVTKLDAHDGKIDQKWRTNDISQLLQGFDTPARIPYQERVIESLIAREGFGDDAVPDLLFLNFKEIDYISHIWSMNSAEMKDAVNYQDAALKKFVGYLDRVVGRGDWAMVLTADHGAAIPPSVSGGFQISSGSLAAQINARFDHDGDIEHVVELVQPTQIFMDMKELAQNNGTLDDVARFITTLTEQDTAGIGVQVDPGHANDRVFTAAFPSALMTRMPCLSKANR
jgi:hypothetical protein